MNKKSYPLFCMVTVAILLLSACGEQQSSPTPTPIPSLTSTPTATVTPTVTFTPIPTLTPTATPIPLQSITLSNAPQLTEIYQVGYGTIRGASWSPDGQILVLASTLGIYVYDMREFWNNKTNPFMKQFVEYSGLTTIAFSPNGNIFATGSQDGAIQIWNAIDLSVRYLFESAHKDNSGNKKVSVLTFSPQGDYLASGGWDGNVKVWNLSDGELNKTIPAFVSKSQWIEEIGFSVDGRLIYVVGINGPQGVKIFDLENGGQLNYKSLPYSEAYAFSNVRGIMAVSSDQGVRRRKLEVFSDETLESIGLMSQLEDGLINSSSRISALTFSPDGAVLTSSDRDGSVSVIHEDGNVTLWDTTTLQSIAMFPVQNSAMDVLSFSPDGTVLLTGGDSGVSFWDTSDGTLLALLEDFTSMRGMLIPQTRKLVSISQNGSISVWDLSSNTVINQSKIEGRIFDVAFNDDGHSMAITTSLGIQMLKYDNEQISSVWNLDASDAETVDVVTVGDATYLAYSLESTRNVRMLDVTNQTDVSDFFYQDDILAISMSMSSDGKVIAITGFGYPTAYIEIWDTQTSTKTKVASCNTFMVWNIQFSPDDTLLAGACNNKTALLGMLNGGVLWTARLKQWVEVSKVAFSPDGSILASGDRDGKIMLWTVANGDRLLTIDAHLDMITSLAFSEDGTMLISSSQDGTTKVWGIP